MLAFFFCVEEADPVHVKIESYPTLGDLKAIVRRRLSGSGEESPVPIEKSAFEGGGFDEGVRLDLHSEAHCDVELYLRRFRQVLVLTFRYAPSDREAYTGTVEAMIGSLQTTASSPRGLPHPEGWRVETTESFEIATNAEPEVSEEAGNLLEASLKEMRRVFPEAGRPSYRYVARFFGDAESFSAFKKESNVSASLPAVFFEEARAVVFGVLPFGKQSRRFSRAEIDILETTRCVFRQFILQGTGALPEAWFTEGAALYFGLGLGPALDFSDGRVEWEAALGIEEALTSREAPAPSDLFERERLEEGDKIHAVSWVVFFERGPGQKRKDHLQAYLNAFAESWDGKKAREKAFAKVDFKRLRRTHARWFLYKAMRAKRGR